LDERLVPRVRARGGERLPQLAHGTGWVEAVLPGAARVLQEALVAIHGWLAVLGPQAARAAEGRDAALHRQAGPGERDHVARAGETLGRALEGIELPRFHRAAPGLSRRPPSVSTRTGATRPVLIRRAAGVDRTERAGIWLPHERVGRGGDRRRRPRRAHGRTRQGVRRGGRRADRGANHPVVPRTLPAGPGGDQPPGALPRPRRRDGRRPLPGLGPAGGPPCGPPRDATPPRLRR